MLDSEFQNKMKGCQGKINESPAVLPQILPKTTHLPTLFVTKWITDFFGGWADLHGPTAHLILNIFKHALYRTLAGRWEWLSGFVLRVFQELLFAPPPGMRRLPYPPLTDPSVSGPGS